MLGEVSSARPRLWSVARRRSLLAAAFALLLALLPSAWLWQFTVDDALITARVAHHVATGVGYRFNAGDPISDAVTPLGFPLLLAPFAGEGPLAALRAAKIGGLLVWLVTAAAIGAAIGRCGQRLWRFSPLALLATSVPLGAWAVAGMETPLVTALATWALVAGRFTPLVAGFCAAWRPELIPWAATLACGMALVRRRRVDSVLFALLLTALLPLSVALVRQLVFGSPAPLSVLAKPPDFDHGLRYAIGGLLLSGPPFLVLGPWRWRSLPPRDRVVLAAGLVHLGAVVLAGGDWMAFYRLLVPVLPGLLLVGAALAERSPSWANTARLVAAVSASLLLLVLRGPDARHVGLHRQALIRSAAASLAGAERVAALDVGWVGAATGADLLDLAGVTDRQIAALPGGHTSKRIPAGLIEARGTDRLVLLLGPGERLARPWQRSRFARAVEQRLAREAFEAAFVTAAVLPLGGTRQSYVVLRRVAGPD